ncbi:MAG: uracil-DNA glycosylase [Lachnospiraceae bacterium]|nr:uracil-DNA glycosylase [Lachnospiraceae bacterium]
MAGIANDWLTPLRAEFSKPYYRQLYERMNYEYSHNTVFPPASSVYRAFELTPLSKVKVVILGQDPYHNFDQAMGLSFSVPAGVQIPPSLENIYKEISDELGCYIPDNGDLTKWASQGVLLLNTVLTVRAHAPQSHANLGWEQFTDAAIRAVNALDRPVVFLLWGAPAGRKAELLTNPGHLVLKAPHPSPLSAYRGFFGCGHFKKTNDYLVRCGLEPIDWQIENIQEKS